MPNFNQRITTFSPSPEDRQVCLKNLTSLLQQKPEVIFAYAHGSFVQDQPIRDLDIAVYLDTSHLPENRYFYEDSLSRELARSLETSFPIDARILNHAPISFQYHVIQGYLLLDTDLEARIAFMEHTISRYLDMEPLLRHHIREVMESGPES